MASTTVIADYFAQQAKGLSFAHEPFFSLRSDIRFPHPQLEMLARHPDGSSAGTFFDHARQYGRVVEMDLQALKKAVEQQMKLGLFVSVNLNAETIFSPQLMSVLRQFQNSGADFDPHNFCFEMTEQGGIPDNYNREILLVLKAMGFTLALDDFDFRDAEEIKRLQLFAPDMDIIKFPYQVMEHLRQAPPEDRLALAGHISAIKEQHPHVSIVMEGVRSTDTEFLHILAAMGVDIVQRSSYKGGIEAVETDSFIIKLNSPFVPVI